VRWGLGGSWLLLGGLAGAQSTAPVEAQTRQMLAMVREVAQAASQEVARQHPGVRVDTEVGQLDPRLKLAECPRIEPFLPAGTKAWGALRIGLKCVDGPVRWSVTVPARVRVWAPALVARTPLPLGHVLGPDDVDTQEVDLAAEASAALTEVPAVQGRVLAQPVAAGQALRASHLKARQWFAAGDTVSLSVQGAGFAISSEGVAMAAGADGQVVRVKTDSGRVVQGVATGPRRVEISL